MLPPWPADPAWTALLQPVAGVVEAGAARLRLRPGQLDAWPVLPEDLLVPGAYAPGDQAWLEVNPDLAALALDRWRRAAGLLLEGLALAGLEEEVGAPLPRAWWTLGPAAEAVDVASPELGWLWPEAADLLRRPELGLAAAPRRAAWLVRWFRASGRPWPLGERPVLHSDDWEQFGAWLHDPVHGPSALAPSPLFSAGAPPPPPEDLPALSFVRVQLRPGPAGERVQWTGGTRLLCPGPPTELLLGSVSGGPLLLERSSVLPLGSWVFTGGAVGENIGAARGIELELHADGRIDLVFADAFAGPMSGRLLELAAQFGVSGTGRGRFRLTEVRGPSEGSLVFESLDPGLPSVHARFSGRFSLPAETFLGPATRAMQAMVFKDGAGPTWRFRMEGETLRLESEVFGAPVVLRLERPEVG